MKYISKVPLIELYPFAAAAAKSLQSCPTLSDPMDCSLPGSSVHGVFQARVLEWGAIAFSDPFSKYPQNCISIWGLSRMHYHCMYTLCCAKMCGSSVKDFCLIYL